MTPTPRTLLVFGAGFLVALLPAVAHAGLWPVWLIVLLGAVGALGWDLWSLLPGSRMGHRLDTPPHLYVGREGDLLVHLRVPRLTSRLEVDLRVEMDGPVDSHVHRRVVLEGADAEVRVPVRPRRRGRIEIVELWLSWEGPLGLVRRRVKRAVDLGVDVLPDLHFVRDTALQYASSSDLWAGMHVIERTGDGSEFDSIREFAPGMDSRAIHWKASARHRKLLVREFRAERNHQVVLAFDCGHLMAEPLGPIPRLDHAINAGLLLSWFGLRFGDRVGLYGFAARPRVYVAPQSGVGNFTRLQAGTTELDYRAEETNFTLGLAHLSTQLRQRALVVVLTDFVDSISAELMVENLSRLSTRHLVLFVTLRDPLLDAIVEGDPGNVQQIGRAVVAAEMVRERDVVLRRLQRRGVMTLDTSPDQLSSGLINHYLEVKRREMIA